MEASVLARLDVIHARRVGEMLVTQAAPDFDIEPEELLFDFGKMDGRALLEAFNAHEAKFGTTPFDPLGNLLRLYPGGITIWSGYPGAGKTTLLRQLVCHILHRGSSVFLASFEEDPRKAIVLLAKTAAGTNNLSVHQMQWFIDAYLKRFRLWGVIGIARHLKLLAVIRKLAQEGIRHAVLDSLMFLDVANDDIDEQRKFAVLLAATARAANIHIHLVAHPRKVISSSQEPDLNDIAGAKELGAMADNAIFVRKGGDQEYSESAQSTPMVIVIKKQRHYTGHLGKVEGWFHRDFRQFSRNQFTSAPARYLPDDAFEAYSRPLA